MTSFCWPAFETPVPIDGTRAWSATFESYDQRNDDVYYVVSLQEHGRNVRKIMALLPAGNDSGPELAARLESELHAIALVGRSNTEYRGPVGRHAFAD